MKKMLMLAAATIVLSSCSSDKYVIEGTIGGLAGKVYLFDEQNNLVDSAAVEEGAFRFTGKVETPAVRILTDAPDQTGTFGAMLILEPGTIRIADDPQNNHIKRATGTPSNDASAAYSAAANGLIQEFRNPETTDMRREAIEDEFNQLTRKTIEANRSNFFGAVLLAQQLAYELSGAELLEEIAKFPPEIQQTDMLAKLKQDAEQKIRTETGQPYIDIVQPDAAGKEISLKSVVENHANKYTLVDFWASWCSPCMGEVPHLKKTYEEFHPKGFEIYGVSLDKDREAWLASVEQHGMDWIQVCTLEAFDSQAAKNYAVQAIPSNFLIDSEGKIVAKNLRGEELYEKVSELIGE